MCPQIVIRPKEEYRELAHIMSHLIDIGRYSSRMADLSWPPPVSSNFYPDNFPVMWLFACLTIIAIPVSFRDINVQAFTMKSSRARITAQKAASF